MLLHLHSFYLVELNLGSKEGWLAAYSMCGCLFEGGLDNSMSRVGA